MVTRALQISPGSKKNGPLEEETSPEPEPQPVPEPPKGPVRPTFPTTINEDNIEEVYRQIRKYPLYMQQLGALIGKHNAGRPTREVRKAFQEGLATELREVIGLISDFWGCKHSLIAIAEIVPDFTCSEENVERYENIRNPMDGFSQHQSTLHSARNLMEKKSPDERAIANLFEGKTIEWPKNWNHREDGEYQEKSLLSVLRSLANNPEKHGIPGIDKSSTGRKANASWQKVLRVVDWIKNDRGWNF